MDEISFARGKGDGRVPAGVWSVHLQGNCLQFHVAKGGGAPRHKRKGKHITQFGKGSRMRLLRMVNRIAWNKVGGALFITLTYPDTVDSSTYKRTSTHRYLFVRRLEEYCREPIAILWRLEWKGRQTGERAGEIMPHFHLMALTPAFVPHEAIRHWWRVTIGAFDGPIATDVRRVRSGEGCARYLSKYLAKLPSLDIVSQLNKQETRGRHWGLLRKHLVPFAPVILRREMTKAEIEWTKMSATAKWEKFAVDFGCGFTVLGDRIEPFWRVFFDSP